MEIKEEIKFFNEHLNEWLKHYEGKFALIYNQKLIDTFTTEEEAYEKGINKFGEVNFLIRLITKKQPIAQTPALFAGIVVANS